MLDKKSQKLKDTKIGENFSGRVMLTEWSELPFKKKPGTYLTLTCQDSSGSISGKMWEPKPQHLEMIKRFKVFTLGARIGEFRGEAELEVIELEPVNPSEVDLSEFMPSSPYMPLELEDRLNNLVSSLHNPLLNTLLEEILKHPIHGRKFREAPAAKKMHQAYLRGLLEHSIKVTEISLGIAQGYSELDRDLLIVGSLVHDIGKIVELDYSEKIDYTTDGRLLGHIILGVQLIDEIIRDIPGFDPGLRVKLLHILVSHHGEYEFQSPKKPKFAEALIIHHADALEADLFKFSQANAQANQEWNYVSGLARWVYSEMKEMGF